MPVSTCLAGNGSSLVGLRRLYWMKTRFHSSKKRWQSPLTWQTCLGRLVYHNIYSPIEMDLTARSAWTGFSHLPEIILASEEQDMSGSIPGCLLQISAASSSCRDIAFIIPENSCPQFLFGQSHTSVSSSHAHSMASFL